VGDGAQEREREDRAAVLATQAMHVGENVVYAAVGLLLIVAAGVAVVVIGYHLVTDVGDGAIDAVTAALDGLLLVFILVELLGAVRATVRERKLVAEPFLVVGIIAAIKEIVVASLEAGHAEGEDFDHAMTQVGVLAGVVLLLAVSSFLVRRKEREPAEE
jgi:uncharacterized membrane protein (DUF373 family)